MKVDILREQQSTVTLHLVSGLQMGWWVGGLDYKICASFAITLTGNVI